MALACTFAVAGCGTRSDTVHAPKDDGAAAENGIAVVELFTSEGCSSCPPADALLKRLADEARQDKRPVYCLAFHVDYFNRLGWVDKLSDAAYTHRQEWYGGLLDGVEVYTPMMIVNGRSPFLGYDEATARKNIQHGLQTPTPDRISLKIQNGLPGGEVRVEYQVEGPVSGGIIIHVAITESGISRKIAGGENAGKLLLHDCVVRSFKSESVGTGGEGSIAFDPSLIRGAKPDSIIAFLQNEKDGTISGAARQSLSGIP